MCCENHSKGNHIQNPKNNTKPTRICNLQGVQLYSVLVFDGEYQFHPNNCRGWKERKGGIASAMNIGVYLVLFHLSRKCNVRTEILYHRTAKLLLGKELNEHF